ncbi:MAG: thiol oxidoreductase, partial [Gemmatimonadetes bacterium]|nr:thiol oxidoreductase [Gemmatimonadota bacterium]
MGPEVVPGTATDTALMTAPPLFGLGLVEAVPDAVLAERADPEDLDGDGISGRLPRLPDGRTARFGRKGDAATLEDFVDTALRFELGFTTALHPAEEARNAIPVPAAAD